MTKRIAFLFLSLFVCQSAFGQTKKWTLNKSHSRIGFSVTHLVISTVKGQFDDFSLTVLSDKPDFSDSKVELSITTSSVNTQNERRDNHLRGADFFDVESFPTMTFKSKGIEKVGDNKYKITGDLAIKDITKTVVLNGEFGGAVKAGNGMRAGFQITGEINRFDYGVKWDRKMDSGGLVVSEAVKIECDIQLDNGQR